MQEEKFNKQDGNLDQPNVNGWAGGLLSEKYFKKNLNDNYILTHLNVSEASKEIKIYGEIIRKENFTKETVKAYGLDKKVTPVVGCRSVKKKDMKLNDFLPDIKVDAEVFVRLSKDGKQAKQHFYHDIWRVDRFLSCVELYREFFKTKKSIFLEDL